MPTLENRKGQLMPNAVRIHRVLRSAPERVYRAFLDADAMAKWLPPNGFTGKVHHLDAKLGGTYRLSITNFTSHPSRTSPPSPSPCTQGEGEMGIVPRCEDETF
jgi:hypothetical protein